MGGAWIAPNETDWPLCEYKDEYSCDPVEEIDKTDAYLASGAIQSISTRAVIFTKLKQFVLYQHFLPGLKPQSTSFVYRGDQATFVCNQTGYVTDQGESLTVDCDELGNFVQNIDWPICR